VAAYFLDSSAAVKRYVRERGTAWVTHLMDPAADHDLLLVRITAVEIAAALYRRVRAGTVAIADAARAVALLRRDLVQTYAVLEFTPTIAGSALELAKRYGLRGYDCVQLAAAVLTHRQRTAAQLSPLILVSADLELNASALEEGLTAEDPNNHPL
jgi:uncharacterized protein